MEQLKGYSSKVEEVLDRLAAPIKPYVPALARFLIVVTFLEDSLRIVSQWNDQLYYLQNFQHMPWGVSHIFLLVNVVLMLSGSIAAILKKYTTIAAGSLGLVVILQAVGYGLIFDLNFFFRNLSVIGGLLMLLSDGLMKKKDLFAGLPQLSETDKTTYLQLAGRILLVALFFSLLIAGEMSLFRAVVAVLGFGVSIMVVIGFQAKYSALFLVLILSVANVILNNWWSLHHNHPSR